MYSWAKHACVEKLGQICCKNVIYIFDEKLLTLTHAIIWFFPHSYTSLHNLVPSLWTHLLGGEAHVSWNHQVVVGFHPYLYHIFLQCHNDHLSFCKEARDLMASLFTPPHPAPNKKRVKKELESYFLTWSILIIEWPLEYPCTCFFIFHGYLWKYKNIWPILGNKPKRGERN